MRVACRVVVGFHHALSSHRFVGALISEPPIAREGHRPANALQHKVIKGVVQDEKNRQSKDDQLGLGFPPLSVAAVAAVVAFSWLSVASDK